MRVSLALLAAAVSLVDAGPIGFVFDGDQSTGYKVDLGTGIATPFGTYLNGFDVAIVDSKIRLGQRDDGTGFEYDLNGNPTGASFTGGSNFSQLLDGTTDGVHNYGVQCCAQGGPNSVVTADLRWQGATSLFALPADGRGITYDTASATLFVALQDSTVHHYSLLGVDLGSFSLAFTPFGLAYDAASDTLWTINLGNGTRFVNLSTAGASLGTVASATSFFGPFGFEIDNGIVSNPGPAPGPAPPPGPGAGPGPAPEPGTLGMLGAALGLLAAGRRVFRTSRKR